MGINPSFPTLHKLFLEKLVVFFVMSLYNTSINVLEPSTRPSYEFSKHQNWCDIKLSPEYFIIPEHRALACDEAHIKLLPPLIHDRHCQVFC